jgi:transcriptional regulator GlxA family with amidase domain
MILYPVEQPMDVIGPWEIFSTWKNTLSAPLDMYLISETGDSVACDNGITLNANTDFTRCPQLDYLIIPGGRGRITQTNNPVLLKFIQQQAPQCKHILSVCTGAFILIQSGILQDEFITTYWRDLPELLAMNNVHVKEQRIVKSGKIWASGGVSSGIDLALEVIADVAGKETAGKVQLLFEYFPEGKLFATLDTMKNLPTYYNNSAPPHLAEYIEEYIKARL